MHPTRIDIPLEIRTKIIELLNARLADIIDLQLQAKQAHWNVKGPNFIAVHELFDELAEELEDQVDSIAERVTALGGTAEGSLQAVFQKTTLKPYSMSLVSSLDHLEAIANGLAAFGKLVRAAIDQATTLTDAGTADLFTGISREIDKKLWFIEAHLQLA